MTRKQLIKEYKEKARTPFVYPSIKRLIKKMRKL
jgi:hypothetical protein